MSTNSFFLVLTPAGGILRRSPCSRSFLWLQTVISPYPFSVSHGIIFLNQDAAARVYGDQLRLLWNFRHVLPDADRRRILHLFSCNILPFKFCFVLFLYSICCISGPMSISHPKFGSNIFFFYHFRLIPSKHTRTQLKCGGSHHVYGEKISLFEKAGRCHL